MKKARSLTLVLVLVFVLTLASSLASPAQANMGGSTATLYINGVYPKPSDDEITLYNYYKGAEYGYAMTHNVIYLNPGDTLSVVNYASDGMMQVCYAEYKREPSLKSVTVNMGDWNSTSGNDISNSYTFLVETEWSEENAYKRFLHSDGTWAMGDPARMPNSKFESYDKTYFLPDEFSFTFPESASKDSYFVLSVYSGFEIWYEGMEDEELGYYSEDYVIRLAGAKTPAPAADPPAPAVVPPAPEAAPPSPAVVPPAPEAAPPAPEAAPPAPEILPPPAVVLSSQKLTVDGVACSAEIYNIDGSNYFKLRDIAALLNGTDAQFSVDYLPDIKTICIWTGFEYKSVGGELQTGTDKSASAVRSSQKIQVDFDPVDLTAYNIGGNNFFKLRDLGDALGFDVDYDSATRTILINTAGNPAWDYLESLGMLTQENGVSYAYVTIPADFVEEDETQAQIDAEAGEDFTSGILNPNGSVTYKMNKAQHTAWIGEIAATIDNELQAVLDNPDYCIWSITHDVLFMSFYVDLVTDEIRFREEYMDMAFYIYGEMYAVFAGFPAGDITVTYYSVNGDLIQTDCSADIDW